MEVNASLIKSHRTNRGFTQQHLADACAISLRTIQRVERYGTASSETLMSLSAVFDVPSQLLIINNKEPETTTNNQPNLLLLISVAIIFGCIIGTALTYLAMSE